MSLNITHAEYKHDDKDFDLYAVRPDSAKPKTPTILIAPAWDGLTQKVEDISQQVAALGYVAVAVDLYGKGVRGEPTGDNSALITPFLENREMLTDRLLTSYEAIQNMEFVDETNMGAMGYCFGGLCVLDLARAVPDHLKAVLSFHGILQTNELPVNKDIEASILIEHGWDDPMATPENFLDFSEEMDKRKAPWQAHIHGGTAHAFTFEGAQKPDLGILYNKTAADRSWQSMINFFNESIPL